MMDDAQRLYNIILLVSSSCKINIDEIKQKKQWNSDKREFINQITNVMYQLQDFGFTKSEIDGFVNGAETTLHFVLFLYMMKKNAKKAKSQDEFQELMIREWNSEKCLDNLNDISGLILDDFFEKKGGSVFRNK